MFRVKLVFHGVLCSVGGALSSIGTRRTSVPSISRLTATSCRELAFGTGVGVVWSPWTSLACSVGSLSSDVLPVFVTGAQICSATSFCHKLSRHSIVSHRHGPNPSPLSCLMRNKLVHLVLGKERQLRQLLMLLLLVPALVRQQG